MTDRSDGPIQSDRQLARHRPAPGPGNPADPRRRHALGPRGRGGDAGLPVRDVPGPGAGGRRRAALHPLLEHPQPPVSPGQARGAAGRRAGAGHRQRHGGGLERPAVGARGRRPAAGPAGRLRRHPLVGHPPAPALRRRGRAHRRRRSRLLGGGADRPDPGDLRRDDQQPDHAGGRPGGGRRLRRASTAWSRSSTTPSPPRSTSAAGARLRPGAPQRHQVPERPLRPGGRGGRRPRRADGAGASTLRGLGGSLDPHGCFLLDRGLKTLALRVRRQNASALALARALDKHPEVGRVHYPGLESHPDHRRASHLFDGYGGMLAFELDGGVAAATAFLEAVRLPASRRAWAASRAWSPGRQPPPTGPWPPRSAPPWASPTS